MSPRNRVRLLVYGGLAFVMIAASVGWALVYGPKGSDLDRGDNGLWMRRLWLHGGHETDVAQLARQLDALGIRRVYPFLGPPDDEGWPGWRDDDGIIRRYDPEQARAFLDELRSAAPDVRILPWTGGVLGRDVRLDDLEHRALWLEHLAEITQAGAHGVQINVEPLPDGTTAYLDLLRDVKEAIGPDRVLGVAAYPPTTTLHPHGDVHWSLEFTREVCMIADELAVMAYDTAITQGWVYETLVAWWTRELAKLPPPEEGGCEVLIGVPAYEDDEPWHDPEAETLGHGIAGVRRGLVEGAPEHVRGIAIYAGWTTDAEEWATFESDWIGRDPTGAVVDDR